MTLKQPPQISHVIPRPTPPHLYARFWKPPNRFQNSQTAGTKFRNSQTTRFENSWSVCIGWFATFPQTGWLFPHWYTVRFG